MNEPTKIQSTFWKHAKVAVIGGGSWGTVLASLLSRNCNAVRLWVREEELARSISATRVNRSYHPKLVLSENIQAYSSIDRVFEGGVQAVVWALPAAATRATAREFARCLRGDEVVFHATKGVESGSLKRISEVLREEWPCPRIGVLSGPNLAEEIARGEPSATVAASYFDEVIEAGQALLFTPQFRVYGAKDVVGVEWAGVLKNVLAIASGVLDGLALGWNTRAMLISRGLAEMVRFGHAMGANESTFLGLAGVGDLLATSMSPLSRNFRVGRGLAQKLPLNQILEKLGGTAEGVTTTRSVWEFAQAKKIDMPITEAVFQILYENKPIEEALHFLMTRPLTLE